MALLLKCGAIFLHLPKCGGSWVTEVLEEQNLVRRRICHIHADVTCVQRYLNVNKTIRNELLSHVKAFLPGEMKRRVAKLVKPNTAGNEWPGQSDQIDHSPYMFCFVRHPLRWYESFWCYMSKYKWPKLGNQFDVNNWHPKALLNGTEDNDFNQFIRNVLVKRPGFVTEMYGWYTLPAVNFIGKQEHLADDLIIVLEQLNVRFDEERIRNYHLVNSSKTKNNEIIWDKQLCKEVTEMELAGIKRYGY